MEINSKPPNGAITEERVFNTPYLFMVKVNDLPSLFAGKLHAVLYRQYVKGRDFYDLFWMLTKKVEPNFTLFKNAVYQTQKEEINPEHWRKMFLSKLEELEFKFIQNDVEKFLRNKRDVEFMNMDYFQRALKIY